jgi:prepilin-type N-terminal cleavage/methylation domain-containing protein
MRAPDRGFSLIELLVVLAIVSLLVGASAVGFNIARTPRMLGLAAAQIVADLRAAQQRARLERVEYVVTFSVGSGHYGIARVEGGGVQRVKLPRGVVISATTWRAHRVTFSTFGDPHQTGKIHIRNRAGERSVYVDEMGRISTTP